MPDDRFRPQMAREVARQCANSLHDTTPLTGRRSYGETAPVGRAQGEAGAGVDCGDPDGSGHGTRSGTVDRCPDPCGYKLIGGQCPVCHGKQPRGATPRALIPRELRQPVNIPQHFESLRHYYAWRAGIGLGTESGRRKVPQRFEDIIRRQYRNRCQWPGGCDSSEYPTLEHIRPVAFGGSNHPGNITLLCSQHQRASWERFEQMCLWVEAAS